MMSLPDDLRYWSLYRPEEEAIVCDDVRLDWLEFHAQASAVAAGLQRSGIRIGDRVGILLPSRAEWAVAFAGIWIAGAAVVPLNPRFGPFELQAIEQDAECALVISTPSLVGRLGDRFTAGGMADETITLCPRRGSDALPSDYAALVAARAEPAPVELTQESLAAIFYTSGTTGLPKGATYTHRSIILSITSQVLGFQLTSADRTVVIAALAFTGACLSCLTTMLVCGGCTVIERRLDPARLLRLIGEEKISFMTAVPAVWERMVPLDGFAEADLSSIRVSLAGARR